ncbi:MAG: hypothetical protein ABI480_16105, partial [Chitinophagaceae bacterium]
MAATLLLTIPEIILLLFGAIILGITIHFFITSRRNLNASAKEMQKPSFAKDEWKLRYLNDMELRDKEVAKLKEEIKSYKDQLADSEENVNIYSIEADEMRKRSNELEAQLKQQIQQTQHAQAQQVQQVQQVRKEIPVQQPSLQYHDTHPDYLEQLKQAQTGLVEQNQKINQLLDNIDLIREQEEKQRQILRDNAALSDQINQMRTELSDKEKEVTNIRQKEHLTKEMTSMLDSAYSEFNVLQSKIQKLETQLTSSRMLNMEYEDLKEEHAKMAKEHDDHKVKLTAVANDNAQLQMQVMEAEDKLREANFQRQQLQKRVAYLEELNNDLQVVSDANKKLESQLRRIGELESMLN